MSHVIFLTSFCIGVPAGSACQAEADQFFVAAELLRLLGARVGHGTLQNHLDIPVRLGPLIVFDPSFALFPCEIRQKFPTPDAVTVSTCSALTIMGSGVTVESIRLNGALKLVAEEGKPSQRLSHKLLTI
jgi:hypothetical protein